MLTADDLRRLADAIDQLNDGQHPDEVHVHSVTVDLDEPYGDTPSPRLIEISYSLDDCVFGMAIVDAE